MQTIADAVDRRAEPLLQLPGVAVVMAVGQQDVLRRTVFLKLFEAVGGDHRIEDDPFGGEVVRADVHSDVLMARGPMPQARADLAHPPSIAAVFVSAAPTAATVTPPDRHGP